MKKVYHFVTDPSHGWLKVPVAELKEMGLYDQISVYSYELNGMGYLEEDADMTLFIEAKKAAGVDIKLKTFSRNQQSRIRNYPMFNGGRLVERTNAMTGEKFTEAADTPFACSPSSETYWSA